MNFWQWLKQSSEDPSKLSLTLKSFIPLVLMLALLFGFDLNEGDLVVGIEQIVALLTSIGLIWGLMRKIINSNSGKFGAFWK